jgi:hypothetical protein
MTLGPCLNQPNTMVNLSTGGNVTAVGWVKNTLAIFTTGIMDTVGGSGRNRLGQSERAPCQNMCCFKLCIYGILCIMLSSTPVRMLVL